MDHIDKLTKLVAAMGFTLVLMGHFWYIALVPSAIIVFLLFQYTSVVTNPGVWLIGMLVIIWVALTIAVYKKLA